MKLVDPLIESFEGIPYDAIDSVSFLDQKIEVDETGVCVESFNYKIFII